MKVLHDHGLPSMRRQVDTGGEEWDGRVDFRDDVLALIVEVQSEKHHTSLVDTAADAARRGRLQDDGFIVVEVWDTAVWHDPRYVAEQVRAGRRDARAARRAA